MHATLRDLDDLLRDETGSRVMGAFGQSQFVTSAFERQRHLVDRLGVEYAALIGTTPSPQVVPQSALNSREN